jgi:microsomal dipeptidase-like Zn-dependent dipeptidase
MSSQFVLMLVWTAFFLPRVHAQTPPVTLAPAPGFADLHNHMFAEHAFDGAWMHGTVEGELSRALSACEPGSHARIRIPLISKFIGKTVGGMGDTGDHSDRVEGHPTFRDWPRWDTIAHQQVWEGHLKGAHEGGLSLLVVSLVNFEPLCDLMPEENRKTHDCSDIASIDRQLDAVDRFERGHSWFKVVRTPLEAREAIQGGKMAVVLSIEASHLFGDGDWRPEFEKVYARGVRTLQIAHQLNNRFAGAAIHHPVFRIFAWWEDFQKRGRWWEVFTPGKFGFQMERDASSGTKRNLAGLTQEGKDLLTLMMKRGMPIDLAHLSEQAVREIQPITRSYSGVAPLPLPGAYPVYISHGHFREAMNDGKFSIWEKSSPPWILDYIKESGGMFGLRTGPEKTKDFPDSPAPNDCQGSTKSFAQTVQYGEHRGLKLAFGTDLNGFIQQLRPRFGNPEETCGAETQPKERRTQQILQTQPLHERFDQSGFGDISQVKDILQELKNFEVKTQTLHRSTEEFIQMWERATWLSRSLKD